MQKRLQPQKLADLVLGQGTSLEELCSAFPQEWQQVSDQAVKLIANRHHNAMRDHLVKAKETTKLWTSKIQKSGSNPQVIKSAMPYLAKARMTRLAYEQYVEATLEIHKHGLNRWDRWVLAYGLRINSLRLESAPAFWMRFWFALVTNKALLMTQLKGAGVYSLYSAEFIRGLKDRIGSQQALEIGAGDGTLSRFLASVGCDIRATDDYSWGHVVRYQDHVEKASANQALASSKAPVIICAWPPPDNNFENQIFRRKETESYFLITSAHLYAAGNWQAYQEATNFEIEVCNTLSKGLFPSEADALLVHFRRIRS